MHIKRRDPLALKIGMSYKMSWINLLLKKNIKSFSIFGILLFAIFTVTPAYAVKCIQAGYFPSEGAVDCRASTIIDDNYIGIVGGGGTVGPTQSVTQAEADGIAWAKARYHCYVGTTVTQDWVPPSSWGDAGRDANGRELSTRNWNKNYLTTYQQSDGYGNCYPTTFTVVWGLRRDQTAACTGKYYDTFFASEGGDNSMVCWNTLPTEESCDSKVGNPVDASSGAKTQREDHLAAGPLPLSFYYKSSRNLIEGNVPASSASLVATLAFDDRVWRHGFDKSLKFSTNSSRSSVRLIRPDRIQDIYFSLVNSAWKPVTTLQDELIELPPGSSPIHWRYHTADDNYENYDISGKLLSMVDRAGRTQTLTYDLPVASGGDDDPGTLDIVTDDVGHQLHLTYDTQKRIATIIDPAGGIITYGYDAQSNLTSVTYPDGSIRTYQYNEPGHTSGINLPHALTGITDENGSRFATYTYDAQGRAISTEHATSGIEKYSLAYAANGSSTSVTDPLGTVRTLHFATVLGIFKSTGSDQPGGSGCSAASNNVTYDVNGNIASRTDFNGHRTNYIFDLVRNLETSRTEGLTAAGVTAPQTRTIITEWHPTFRLPIKITEPGLETTYTYDTKGNITLKSLKDLVTNKTRSWTTAYTYSVAGLLVQKVDDGPRTDISDLTTYDYYPEDAVCSDGSFGCRGQLKQITDTLGHITSLSRYSAHGQPELITDPNGLILTMVYDARQRLTSLDSGGELITYRYDPAGQLIRVTQPNSAYLDYTYDNAHRLTDIKDQLGNTRHYTLDNMGNRTKDELFDPNGQLTRSQSRVYDALSRLQNLVLPQ